MAVQDSRLWHSTSKPDAACTADGMLLVLSGSHRPRVGFSARWATPVLAFTVTRSKMAVPVVSEPVPAVVGIAMSGLRGFVMGRPFPRGAFTKSRKSASGKLVYRFIIFAVSITEPPSTISSST
jgi:hypothetical protein